MSSPTLQEEAIVHAAVMVERYQAVIDAGGTPRDREELLGWSRRLKAITERERPIRSREGVNYGHHSS